MEDPAMAQSSAASNAGKKIDPASGQRKHAAILERLSNRVPKSAATTATAAPAFESVDSFLQKFSEARKSVEASIDRCISDHNRNESLSGAKLGLESVSAAIGDLEKLVAENSYFLPSYEVRAALKNISDLRESLDQASAELVPRKRFAFSNKSAKNTPQNPSPKKKFNEEENSRVQARNSSAEFRDKEGSALVKDFRGEEEGDFRFAFRNKSAKNAPQNPSPEKKFNEEENSQVQLRNSSAEFRSKEGSTLVKDFRSEEEGDFSLCDLSSCQIYIRGKCRALFIHRLKNCKVFAGPVLSSVLIEDVENCILMLASHQIRIHHARSTDFYLRVRSRPIIEDSSGVRFAPYSLKYEGIDQELEDSGLSEETANWKNVDDFRWLRAIKSPNWCVLPDEDRSCVVDISDFF